MQQAWAQSDIQALYHSLKNGQGKMLGKGHEGYHPKASNELMMQSTGAAPDAGGANKKGFPGGGGGGGQLPDGGGVQAVHQQQQQQQQQANQQFLLTPASLQLAQLQAHLTLHRLKLAQGAVGAGNNNAATAATFLNQVLSNVAMSQPLFNQLRTSPMVGNHHPHSAGGGGGFPSGALGGFSSLVNAGNFAQNPVGNVKMNYGGGAATGASQQGGGGGGEYGKKAGSTYPCDTDRRHQYGGFLAGTSVTASANKAADVGQYGAAINAEAKITNNVGFQRDYYGQQDLQGQQQQQQAGFGGVNEQKMNAYGASSAAHKEPSWKGPAVLNHNQQGHHAAGKSDMVTATTWTAGGQPIRARPELYNPEEPTSDPKFNPGAGGGVPSFGSGGGMQGFVGCYKPLQQAGGAGGGDHGLSTGGGTAVTLQPHQVNDYHALTPSHLPHQCTICDKKVYNLKDWDQHVKGKLHLQNRSLYANDGPVGVVAAGGGHYVVTGVSDGGIATGGNNSMVFSAAAANQDASSAASASYLPAAAMNTFPMSATGFTSHQPGSKPFPPRKSVPGRVVHICNLPEGSCTENDVINLGLPFGKVTNYILMRSTHQAFLEMAYVEAAQAMVQYYQLTPAMINEQKLLIRMSKRYKELQLKKPGKDVESIIHDLNSQRERDEIQALDQYLPERARSRSPISRSLSPRSHSPSFTSCSSAHSPQGAPGGGGGGRGGPPERGGGGGGSNGLGPRRGSWDWSAHPPPPPRRGGEEEREREEMLWRNGGGGGNVDEDPRPNGRMADRRSNKPYLKASDRASPRTAADERGSGGVAGESMRGNNRERYPPRGKSPQGFNSYRNVEEDFYMRPPYQRHEARSKRRDGGGGDYHGSRSSRHSESEVSEELLQRAAEDSRRHGSPARGRSRKTHRKHTHAVEKQEKESVAETNDEQRKERSVSPQRGSKPTETTECENRKDSKVEEWESGDDTEGESWYPKNMEELVTVDEVGEEDDSIIEPDLPELVEDSSCTKEPTTRAEEVAADEVAPPPPEISHCTETRESPPDEDENKENGHGMEETSPMMMEKEEEAALVASPGSQTLGSTVAPGQASKDISDFPDQEFKAVLEETFSEDKATVREPPQEPLENHVAPEGSKTQDVTEINNTVIQQKEETIKKGVPNSVNSPYSIQTEIGARSPSQEQDKAVSEHSIPLGVEFIVPRTGFYCKLCGLFYTSEETAKTAHCRSTVHYRNLQKYLCQLAEESLLGSFTEPESSE